MRPTAATTAAPGDSSLQEFVKGPMAKVFRSVGNNESLNERLGRPLIFLGPAPMVQ